MLELNFHLSVDTQEQFDIVHRELGLETAQKMRMACEGLNTEFERRFACLNVLKDFIRDGDPRMQNGVVIGRQCC